MRRSAIILLVVVSACVAGTAPDTSTTSVPGQVTSVPVSTSTSLAPTSSTTTTTLATSTTQPATTITQAPTSTTLTPTSTTTTRPPTTTTTTMPPATFSLAYQQVASMSFPIHMVARPGSSLSYIATKGGQIHVYDGNTVSGPILNISGKVSSGSEQGLFAIALHPTNTSRIFLHYTNTSGNTVVSEYTMTGPSAIDSGSERIIFTHDQPASNHNGGMILFGPGGLLYVGLGDGGGGNDPYGHGQNPNTLLGGLVSLSVDGSPNPTLYNMGLRNPWRFWLDGSNLYLADVGQNRFEEVNVVSMAAGRNFGWPIMEGSSCHQPSSGCDQSGLTLPVVVVNHGNQSTCSITGGVVYRGSIPEINGHYFYSDWCGGYLRSFRWTGSVSNSTNWTSQVGRPGNVSSFGLDGAGEMYVLTSNAVLKVVRG